MAVQSGNRLTPARINADGGTVLNHAVTGNPVASATSGAESLILATPFVTLGAGRAFSVSVRGQARSTLAQSFTIRIRKGALVSSPLLSDPGYLPALPAAADAYFQIVYEFVNSTAAPVVMQLAVTAQAATTTQLDIKGFSAGRLQVRVQDIGAASQHTGLASV